MSSQIYWTVLLICNPRWSENKSKPCNFNLPILFALIYLLWSSYKLRTYEEIAVHFAILDFPSISNDWQSDVNIHLLLLMKPCFLRLFPEAGSNHGLTPNKLNHSSLGRGLGNVFSCRYLLNTGVQMSLLLPAQTN